MNSWNRIAPQFNEEYLCLLFLHKSYITLLHGPWDYLDSIKWLTEVIHDIEFQEWV